MPIPVANLYYLLCYSWDEFAPGRLTGIASEPCPDILHLFARMLAAGVRVLHRRGLEHGYVPNEEATHAIRGRIAFAESIRCLATAPKLLHCAFDEMSADILTNRIIKSSIAILVKEPALPARVRIELRQSLQLLAQVKAIELEPRHFHEVQLHRNNRIYSFLLNICRFLHESWDATEEAGRYRFRDAARDPVRMRRIFEKFVRNFLARRLGRQFHVSGERMDWWAQALGGSNFAFLPHMITDVTVRSPGRTLVIECKYVEALYNTRYLKDKIRAAHLYQLSAYLRNLECRGGPDARAEGLLLYPTVGDSFDQSFLLQGHRVAIMTLDLNRDWQEIEVSMLNLLGDHTGSSADPSSSESSCSASAR